MTASTARPASAEPVPRRWAELLPTVAAVWAALHTVFGIWWLVDPSAWPFPHKDEPSSLMHYVDPRVGAALFTATAAAGLVVALAMRIRRVPSGVRGLLLTIAVVQAVLFTSVVPDGRGIIFLGYLMALATPTGLAALAVVGSVRHWQVRVLALAIVAVGGLALVTGWADARIVADMAVGVGTGIANNGLGPWHVFAILAGGAIWAGMAARYHRQSRQRCLPCGRPAARWTRPDVAARWGRWVTIVAICCPLPYALVRFTWLTPWPVGFDPADLAAEPGLRLFGVFLGSGAVLGAVLTSGLISRWGERWPFWMPMLAGRSIPWQVAVVPASIVTLALLAASQGFGVMAVHAALSNNVEELLMVGVLPFGLWAPTLGAATLAYYYRRRGRCTACGQR